MRVLLAIVAGFFFALSSSYSQVPTPAASATKPGPAAASESTVQQQRPPLLPCDGKNAKDCGVSKEDLKKARKAFQRGNRIKGTNPEEAFDAFDEAVRLVPRSPEYATAREMVRQHLIYERLRRGNQLVFQKRTVEGAKELQRVLELDPENKTATAALREIAGTARASDPQPAQPSPEDDQTQVRPKPGRQSFHLSGDARMAFSAVTRAFGIKEEFDPSIRSGPVRLDLDHADFAQAMEQLCALTRTFWMPLSSTKVLIAADTPAAHKELDRWVQRTYYLPEFSSAQELNVVVNLLRSMFEIRSVTQQPATATVTVRGPAPVVKAATEFLQTLAAGRPEVMIDFEVFEVNRQMMQTIGVSLPLQFNVFNIPQSALAALGNQNIQDLINQLIASGGINQANSATISALIAQLQSQQSSIFSQPVATFGGGSTLMGISVPPATASLSLNEARMSNLEHVTLRASQDNAATLRLGTRYPILNATFSPISNTAQLTSVIGTRGYVAPFPSFNYEDLGVTLSAKPAIHGTSDVTLDLDMQLRSLGAQSFNGIPVINQRSYKGVITVKDGESTVIAGSVSDNDQLSLSGIPGIGRVPILGYGTSTRSKVRERSELLIIITPHIVRSGPTGSTHAVRVPVSGI